ncbi:MAG: PAS domain-containing protein, partial [Verrucomicrobia bacterium]|nr:PAS domain-containing protein [Verrucomicrobiota bacterium]
KTELEMQNEELLASHAELQTALERYTDLYDFAPVGYLTLGPDGEIRQLNLAAATLLGEDRSRLVNRRLGQFVCLTDRTTFAAFLKSVFAARNPEACEVTLLPAAGPAPVVHIEAGLTPSGEECRAVLTNITERRQGEKDLETALVKYRTLFELFPLGITVADKQGNIVEANRMANKLLGLSAEEQRQRHISGKEWKIIHPDGTPMPADDYASVRALREHRLVENVEMGLVKSA